MASRLLLKLADRLFPEAGEERERFVAAVETVSPSAPCVVWTDRERSPDELDLERADPSPDWLPEWVIQLARGTQPGKHPLHETGAFYCMDFSSIFAASALLTVGRSKRVLDVCAAPGGKSIFASRALEPELLLSNEVIGKRLGMLRSNLARCRIMNAYTQRLDPAELAKAAPAGCDAVIVDAPCSGQSLLSKGIENPGCFHPTIVNHNARRQRRILAASAETVAPGGHLLYSTCTFAPEENEKVVAWFLKRWGDRFAAVELSHLESWRSALSEVAAYRLYPHSGLGAGAFVCLFKCLDEGGEVGELGEALLDYPAA